MKKFNLADYNKERAVEMRERIRSILRDHPGIRIHEVASIVGMSKERVGLHVAAIRQEWQKESA